MDTLAQIALHQPGSSVRIKGERHGQPFTLTVPAIEFAVDPAMVASSDTGLQATLNLAALELVCGEFMALRLREPGAAEGIVLGTFELHPPTRDLADPSGLKAQGTARLAPFVKVNPSQRFATGVTS